jgi:hypothetical protein
MNSEVRLHLEHTNCHAPSKDIAEKSVICEGLRFMADGGIWKDHGAECMTTVGKGFQALISKSAALQKLLGISFPKMEKVLGYEKMQEKMSTKCLEFLGGVSDTPWPRDEEIYTYGVLLFGKGKITSGVSFVKADICNICRVYPSKYYK